MPRCKICKEKYTPRFNALTEKTCLNQECVKAWREQQRGKGLKPISEKRLKENEIYRTLKETFLNGKMCPVFPHLKATEVHHKFHREHERLNDVQHWLAVSRAGHKYIHSHPREAREKGWLI